LNSERKSLAAFTLTAALLMSSLPMLFAAPLASAAPSRLAPGAPLTLSPVSGPRGTLVTVKGTGFAAGETINTIFLSAGTLTAPVTTTDGTGAFTTTFTVSADAASPVVLQSSGAVTSSVGTFTIGGSTLTANPTNGLAGTSTVVSGTGFAPSASVTTTFTAAGGASASAPVTGTTDATGFFSSTIAVSSTAATGAGTLSTVDSLGNAATAAFTVNAPAVAITLSSVTGAPLQVITITGNIPAGPVNFHESNGAVLPLATVGGGGTSSLTVVVPSHAPSGASTVVAGDGTATPASAPFTVLGQSVTIINPPASGSSYTWGSPVFVSGLGFSASQQAAVTLVPTGTTTEVATTTTSIDAFGQVGVPGGVAVNVPVGQAAGTYEAMITDTQGLSAISTFPVTITAPTGQTSGVSLGLSVPNGNACTAPAGTSPAITVVSSPYGSNGAIVTASGVSPENVVATVAGSAGTFLNGEPVRIIINGTQFGSTVNYPIGPSGPTGHDAGAVVATFAFTQTQLTPGAQFTVSAVGGTTGNVGTSTMYVCAPTATLSTTTPLISSPTTVSGSGFVSAEGISGTIYSASSTSPVTFGVGAPGVTQAFTTATNSVGQFSASMTPTAFGVFTLRVTGVQTATATGVTDLVTTTTFTVTPGTISTSPPVFPSQSFVVSGTSGFVSGQSVTLTPTGGTAVTTTVNSTGGFAATLTAPANTPVGNLNITISSPQGVVPVSVTQVITVPTASLSASPNTLAQGASTTVNGAGYIPNQSVTLTTQFLVNGVPVDAGGTIFTTTASSAGTFTATYPVSPSVVVVGGAYWINGVSAASTANSATTPVTLTTGAVAPPGGVSPGQATTIYFAEGYTGRFATNGRADFDEYISVLNPDNFAKTVTFTYQLQGGAAPVVTTTSVPANSDILRLVNGDIGNDQIASAVVSSDGRIAAERIINRTAPSGKLDSSSSLGSTSSATTWYFAEGYTGASFQEYLTVQNPGATTANVVVTFLPQSVPAATPRTVSLTVPANGRVTENIRRDYLPFSDKSVGMIVTSDQPVVAERVTYWGDGNGSAKFGSDSAPGMAGAAKQYFFAYGSNPGGTSADESYVTVINPAAAVSGVPPSDATVLVSFFDASGNPLGSKSITVSPQTRETVVVNNVIAPVSGPIYTAVSSDQPIFVERPQYIGGSPNAGSHPGLSPAGSPAGVTSVLFPNVNTGTASGTSISETVYLLNVGASTVTVNGTYYDPNGQTVSVAYSVAPGKIVVVNVNADAGNLPVGPLGAQYTSSNGAFVAARVANTPDGLSYVGTQGVNNQ